MFCCRKNSEDRLLDRIAGETYGKQCKVLYRDWSSSFQLKGCTPSPIVELWKLMSKRFETTSIEEFYTSRVCNLCLGELTRYRNRRGKLSHSRLKCMNCTTVDAKTNILQAGDSYERPRILCRNRKEK
jgi:hypothetical protein